MSKLVCRIKPYIQPFERELALRELAAMAGNSPEALPTLGDQAVDFEVDSRLSVSELASGLAYWEHVQDRRCTLTRQVLREATLYAVRNGVPIDEIPRMVSVEKLEGAIPNRRCLRYGTHGLHEYRGKYFPQLVRSLINIAEVPPAGIVADPMCGSGTTLVEALLSGRAALGTDMNPLSVFMSRTKCELLREDPSNIETAYEHVHARLLDAKSDQSRGLAYFTSLPEKDQEYLRGWFSEQTLADLGVIAVEVSGVKEGAVRDLFRLALSNIIRGVSWQKEADLRVRKEIRPDDEIDAIRNFLEEIGRSVRTVVAFLHGETARVDRLAAVSEGDARFIGDAWLSHAGKIDAVITSPPYATALPYLDTDRLSLSYLGLLARDEYRRKDDAMIGNREVTERQRRAHWAAFQESKHLLPETVVNLIERIDTLNQAPGTGFRRRNLSALLARYFTDMREVLQGVRRVLRPGAPAYFVVGNNHTVAGGERVEIATADYLAEIAESIDLKYEGKIDMEMLTPRDIFKKNAVASEVIICLRRPT